jgi:arylsulfatase A-like enzyme
MFLNKKEIDVSKTVKRGNTYVLNGESHLDRRMKEKLKSIHPQDYPLPTPLHISKKELNYLIGLYDGEIRYVDYQVGRIISVLKELKTYDKTTIIISSDHGEEFLEHGMFRHGYHLYDEIIKVPLIIISPHFNKTPLEIKTPVNLIDLMPTLLDLLNLPFPGSMQGKSIIPLINQGKKAEPLSISETSWKGARAQSVSLAEWKYIIDIRNERIELYNLGEDSGEKNNLYLKEDEKAEKLSHLLSNIISKAQPVTEKSKDKGKQLEKKHLDKLKSLGYIQ